MDIFITFVGRAEPLAEQYEGVGVTSFVVRDLAPGDASGFVLPATGDLVRLRMHPGPDIRTFRCAGRLFDFSEVGKPLLTIELDMP
jgi:hypothetical protein